MHPAPLMTANPTEYTGDAHLSACPFPINNPNGAGYERLLTEYQAAEKALRRLGGALSQITFHPRDYPPEVGAWTDAQTTRKQLYSLLDEIDSYLTDHIKHLTPS